MLRFESHVFVLCTVLALLTFAVQKSAAGSGKQRDDVKEETLDSDEEEDFASGLEKQMNATQTDKNAFLLKEGPKDKTEFLQRYTSLMASLKDQVYVQTGSEKSRFRKLMKGIKEVLSVIRKQAFIVYVSEETIFQDSYQQIMHYDNAKDMLKRHLSVLFDNNQPFSSGNNKDWFYLLSEEIFNPSRKLFINVDEKHLDINPIRNDGKAYELFQFVGRVFGLALFYEKRIRVNFTQSFYTRILREEFERDDVKEQMLSFIDGLTEIIPREKLKEFNETELESLFCDTEDLDVKEWEERTSYNSLSNNRVYKKNDEQVIWFWEIIKGYNESERRKVLLFATGTDALPVSGFINDWFPFKIIKKVPRTALAVPHIRAFMPGRIMLIPPYNTKKELMDVMNKIVGKYDDEKMN